MASADQQRLNIISDALANIVRQQRAFDQRLGRIEAALHITTPQPPTDPFPEPVPEEPVPPPPPLPEAKQPQRLETSIGLTLINRIGVITLVLGIGFFFKWAVDNNWIGPGGRVGLGLLTGLLAIAAAEILWRRGQDVFAQGVTATGISILYLALYAAFDFYHLIGQGLAFVLMLLVTVLSGALSLRYNSAAIAALGLFGGFLTPLLLSSGEDRPWFLFSYILVVDSCALALARVRNWRVLESLSAAGTILVYAGWFFNHSADNKFAAILFALAFYVLGASAGRLLPVFLISQVLTSLVPLLVFSNHPVRYFAIALPLAAAGLYIADLRRWGLAVSFAFVSFWLWTGVFCAGFSYPPLAWLFLGLTLGFLLFLGAVLLRRQFANPQDLTVLALNGAAYFGISWRLLHTEYHSWMGLFAVVLGLSYLVLAYRLWNSDAEVHERPAALLSIWVGLTFLTLAIPIQFTAYRITMSWALEAAALSWIGKRLNYPRMTYASAIIFALVVIRLFAVDAWTASDGRFLTFAIAAAALWATANWLDRPATLRAAYFMSGHVVMLWALTQEALDWAARWTSTDNLVSVETISVSILWAIYAVILVSLGVATRTAVNRVAGLVLMGLVVLKLYLFDVWQLGRVYRTLAFVALGVLLLSTSFLYSRFRGLIESWWKNDQVRS